MEEKVPVTIIMRSKNEMPYVASTLQQLSIQTYQTWQLINIDSGSSDGTYESVKGYNPNQTIQIPSESYVPGQVLNDGVAMTSSPIIVLLNADAIPVNERWLETLITPLLNDTLDVTFSKQIARANAHFIVKYDFDRAYSTVNIKGKNQYFFSAAACAFKRSVWKAHPFRTYGLAEDYIWSKTIQDKGYRCQLIEESGVEHSHNLSIKKLFVKRKLETSIITEKTSRTNALCNLILSYGKEISRDLMYTIKKGAIHTIPYNMLYRSVLYLAMLRGIFDKPTDSIVGYTKLNNAPISMQKGKQR